MVVNKHELNSFSEDGKEKRKRYLSMSLKYEVDDICGIDGINAVFPPNSTWCTHDIDENILLYLVIPSGCARAWPFYGIVFRMISMTTLVDKVVLRKQFSG